MTSRGLSANRVISRRAVLRGTAGTVTTAVALTSAAPAAAQDGGELDYGGWFDNVDNYDGTVDKTGQKRVTITVGAEGNGGGFAFSPAAVRVDPGTTIVWEWSGNGGAHNVAAEDGRFESEMVSEAGFTFEQTFEEAGIVKYACVPHESMGMKGAVVVGSSQAGGATAERSGLGDVLTIGGGLGLVGALFALFAFATRSRSRMSVGETDR